MIFRNRFAMSFAVLVALGASFSGSIYGPAGPHRDVAAGGEEIVLGHASTLDSTTAMPLILSSVPATARASLGLTVKPAAGVETPGTTGRFLFDGPRTRQPVYLTAYNIPVSYKRLPADTPSGSR